jgi:bifunctional ADP-heptose synthase (sugar kinase/adenylyltransferase)
MAGNVAKNFESLGALVTSVTRDCGTKTRFIDQRSRQQLMRLDDEREVDVLQPQDIPNKHFDAIAVVDYNKGSMNYEMIEHCRDHFGIPVFVDTKKTDLKRLQNCWVKINEQEYQRANSICTTMIVTMGKAGARYKNKIYPAPELEVVDVCGAGDTFLASLCMAYLTSQKIESAIRYAIAASAVTVQHLGCYDPKPTEIEPWLRD